MIELIKLLYFMLPAYIANLLPALCKNLFKKYNFPLDFNKKLQGKPILGPNKTIKGTLLGIAGGILTAFAQYKSYPAMQPYSLINYENWLLLGFLQSFGALFGDAFKSFIKRRLDIQSGQSWIPFDQIDYSIGALAFASIIYFPGTINSLIIIVVSSLIHIIVNHIGYYIRLNKSKW